MRWQRSKKKMQYKRSRLAKAQLAVNRTIESRNRGRISERKRNRRKKQPLLVNLGKEKKRKGKKDREPINLRVQKEALLAEELWKKGGAKRI